MGSDRNLISGLDCILRVNGKEYQQNSAGASVGVRKKKQGKRRGGENLNFRHFRHSSLGRGLFREFKEKTGFFGPPEGRSHEENFQKEIRKDQDVSLGQGMGENGGKAIELAEILEKVR